MRRKKTGEHRPYHGFDYLAHVDPDRLKLIGAITLAWNWIEQATDAALSVSLELDPRIWVEVGSRINGMDGKIAIIKKALPLNDLPFPEEDDALLVRKALNAVETHKRHRDGVIHARLVRPEDIIADTAHRRGLVDEVLISKDALQNLYDRLSVLGREMEQVVGLCFFRWRIGELSDPEKLRQTGELFLQTLARLRHLQQTREALPPLPEFPEEPPGQSDLAANPDPTG